MDNATLEENNIENWEKAHARESNNSRNVELENAVDAGRLHWLIFLTTLPTGGHAKTMRAWP